MATERAEIGDRSAGGDDDRFGADERGRGQDLDALPSGTDAPHLGALEQHRPPLGRRRRQPDTGAIRVEDGASHSDGAAALERRLAPHGRTSQPSMLQPGLAARVVLTP
jgi:hypothetical protein